MHPSTSAAAAAGSTAVSAAAAAPPASQWAHPRPGPSGGPSSMSRNPSQPAMPSSRTHSRQASGYHGHAHFPSHPAYVAHSVSTGTTATSSAMSTPLGGSGVLPPLHTTSHAGGSAGGIAASAHLKLGQEDEAELPPPPRHCPAFLHRILLTHDAAYRRRALEQHAHHHHHHQHAAETDADAESSTTSHQRRPATPASSTTHGMSASTSTLSHGGPATIPPRTPSHYAPPPSSTTALPFVEPLIPPDNFAMVNSRVYRSSLPLKKHFPFLRTLRLRSVLTLILEEYPAPNTAFLEEHGIRFFQFGIPGNKEPFVQIPEDMISNALLAILDVRNHPMLIHCNKGKHRTGCVVGCLRKLQQWSLTAIFDEYRRFSAPKSRSMDQEFVELYGGEEHVWARIEPRWVPRWAGLPRGLVPSDTDTDEEDEEDGGDGDGEEADQAGWGPRRGRGRRRRGGEADACSDDHGHF